jgi:RND family efflux transporter MFP subunit
LRFSQEFATLPAMWLKLAGTAHPLACSVPNDQDETIMVDRNLLKELRIEDSERDGGGRRHWWRAVTVAALLTVLGSGGYYAFFGQTLAVATAVAESPADTVAMPVLEAAGYITARREATVSSKITGRLAEVLIEEGESVTEGQVLARLDDVDARAALELAQARLTAAHAQLGQIEAQLEQARRDARRQQELREKRLNSEQTLETARTQVLTLSAELEAQRGQVGVAEAQLRVAQVDYDNTIVRAPFAGVIVAKAAQPGEIVSPISAGGGFTRTGIGTIVDMDSLEIEVDVNEAYINRVKPRQPVQAVLDAYPDWKIPASVIAIIPTADRSKATVKVRIAIEQKDPRIVPDMGVRVAFLDDHPGGNPAQSLQGVLVPASAVVQRDGASVVFVVQGRRARLRPVTTGAGGGDFRLVENGLNSGERVVLDPPAGLGDGMRIAPRASGIRNLSE